MKSNEFFFLFATIFHSQLTTYSISTEPFPWFTALENFNRFSFIPFVLCHYLINFIVVMNFTVKSWKHNAHKIYSYHAKYQQIHLPFQCIFCLHFKAKRQTETQLWKKQQRKHTAHFKMAKKNFVVSRWQQRATGIDWACLEGSHKCNKW